MRPDKLPLLTGGVLKRMQMLQFSGQVINLDGDFLGGCMQDDFWDLWWYGRHNYVA